MDINIESPKLIHGKEYRNVNHEGPDIRHEFFMIYLKYLYGALLLMLFLGLLQDSQNRKNVLHLIIIRC